MNGVNPVTTETCLTPGCGRDTHSRGVCKRCYNMAWRLVQAKEFTWRELEARGVVQRVKPEIENRSLFLQALEKADRAGLRIVRA